MVDVARVIVDTWPLLIPTMPDEGGVRCTWWSSVLWNSDRAVRIGPV